MSQDEKLPGLHSRFLKEVWRYKGDDVGLIDLLIRRRNTFKTPPVIFPITDSQVLALADCYDDLKDHYLIGLPQDSRLIYRAVSKKGFHEMTEKYNLPAPMTVFIDSPDEIENVAQSMKYPCIVKPEFRSPEFAGVAKQKALCCHQPADAVNFYRSFCHADPRAVIQEWIPGGDGDVYFCLQYYNRDSRPLVSFVGKKIRQWPPLSGGTASCRPVECKELETLTAEFFSKISFHGLCSMEYKRNPVNGEFMMVEPTIGRTDWQSDVANINGIPIPYIAYCDLSMIAVPSCHRTHIKRKWVRWSADREAARHYRRTGELSRWKWLWSIRPPLRWAVWTCADPKPYLSGLIRKFRRISEKLVGLTKR